MVNTRTRRHPRFPVCNREYPATMYDPLNGLEYQVPRICGLPAGHPPPCLSRFADGWRKRMNELRP